jgi:hypothetical protein
VLLVLETQHTTLLQHTSMTVNTVFQKYKEYLVDSEEVYTFGSTTDADKVALAVALHDLTKLSNILFVETWTKRMQVFNDLQKEKALEKAATLINLEKPTSEAAMILDTEQTVDMKTLGELIDRKVAEQTKALTTTINRLQQQASRQPKGQREATKKKEQASTTKNSSRKQQPKKKTEQSSTKDKGKEKDKAKKKKKKKSQSAADGNDSDSSAESKQKSKKKKNTNERNTKKRSSKSGQR